MAVYQYGKKWRADIYFNNIRILSKSNFTSREEAQQWHDEQKKLHASVTIALPSVVEPEAPIIPIVESFELEPINPVVIKKSAAIKSVSNLFFEDLWKRFEEVHLPTVRKGTQVRYQLDIKYRIAPFFQSYELDQITQMLIEDFKIWLMKDLSPKSVNNCLGLLKTIFKKGVQ